MDYYSFFLLLGEMFGPNLNTATSLCLHKDAYWIFGKIRISEANVPGELPTTPAHVVHPQ